MLPLFVLVLEIMLLFELGDNPESIDNFYKLIANDVARVMREAPQIWNETSVGDILDDYEAQLRQNLGGR